MKMEKKLIAFSILAIALGVATILPLEYIMGSEVRANAALPKIEPLFNVNIPYAICNLNKTSSNATMTLYGANIQVVANITLAPNALKDADAQIEYYQFAVSSDQGPILNLGYYILMFKHSEDITFTSGDGTIGFANGLIYKGLACNAGHSINAKAYPLKFIMGMVGAYIFGTNANDVPQAVTDLRNAQTLYVDVSKVCTVTVSGNVTVTTPASTEVLQHIELTKTDTGFVYGAYAEGTLPNPVEKPPTS
jgi:hypothetical protein